MHKKALIITYYWPPAGGPGVQRWLKFVKYLPAFGVEPIIYTPENPAYPIIDESMVNEIPENLHVIKQPIKEPYKFAKLLSKKTSIISKGIISEKNRQGLIERILLFVRGNFFIPDARKNWVKPSVNFLNRFLKENGIETVITTGPPHSLHLIGLELKNCLGVKWIADFRDPWTSIGYHKKLKLTNYAFLRHKELESKVLQKADQIIVTSKVTKKEFAGITPKPIEVITNGYDFDDAQKRFVLDKNFTLAHVGSLLSDRNPEVLWRVLRNITKENKEFANDFCLNLIGTVSETVIESLKNNDLSDYLNIIGYVSHIQSVEYQKKSQVLLLIEINSEQTKSIIPGKLFEYLVSNRPIIAFGPEGSDVKNILKETQTGNYCLYHEENRIKDLILGHYNSFKNGDLSVNPINVEKYSRKSLTESLAKLI